MIIDKRDNVSNIAGKRVQDPDFQIIDSYRITDISEMKEIINCIRDYDKMFPSIYVWDRTDASMIEEWQLHNDLYNRIPGFLLSWKNRVKHVDFNNADEGKKSVFDYIR